MSSHSEPTTTSTTRRGLFTIYGIPVTISIWWLAIFVVLGAWAWPAAQSVLPGNLLGAVAVALIYPVVLFGSVFIHEVSHAVVGRSQKQPPTEIAITLLGGHTQFATAAPNPKAMFLTTAAGPASNLILFGLASAAMTSTADADLLHRVLAAIAITNLLVGLFNLLPGLPLDGGQILAATIWATTKNRETGLMVAARAGVIVGAAIAGYGLLITLNPQPGGISGMWLLFIGIMIGSQAWHSSKSLALHRRATTVSAHNAMREAHAVQVTIRAHKISDLINSGVQIVVMADDLAIGVVDSDAYHAVPTSALPDINISSVMEMVPSHRPLSQHLAGMDLLKALQQIGGTHWAVTDDADQVVGILHITDVEELLS